MKPQVQELFGLMTVTSDRLICFFALSGLFISLIYVTIQSLRCPFMSRSSLCIHAEWTAAACIWVEKTDYCCLTGNGCVFVCSCMCECLILQGSVNSIAGRSHVCVCRLSTLSKPYINTCMCAHLQTNKSLIFFILIMISCYLFLVTISFGVCVCVCVCVCMCS